jgi:3-oxoacyl-[acyl-carrier protein] reductase
MDLQLKGKTAVVTGGTRGIGRAIAECFADEGANVAICARNADQVAEAVKGLEAKGVKAFGAVVDIADGPALQGWEVAKPLLEAAAAKSGDAAFIITSSVSAVNSDNPSSYGAMKAALIHFAKGVARSSAAAKVRCNVVSPGTVFFEDGVWGNVKRNMPGFFDQMIKRNPTGRMATPEEIAAATVFLASPRSTFTTGINMIVDGAITQRVNY